MGIFWSAQTISQIGDEVYTLAIPLIAYAQSGSASIMTLLYGVSMLPHLFFGVAGGAWADRSGKKTPIIVLSLAAVVVLSGLALAIRAYSFALPALVVGVFTLSVVTAALLATYDGALHEVVEPDRRIHVISLLETSRTITVVLGPVLAGFLVSLWRGAFPLVIDAASFAVAATVISFVRFTPASPVADGAPHESFMKAIQDGLSYLWSMARIRYGVLLSTSSNLALGAFEILVVYRLRGGLGTSGGVTGFVFAAGGAAAFVASLVAPKIAKRIELRSGMTVGLIGIGVSAVVLAIAPNAWVVSMAQCLYAAFSVEFNIFWRTYRQNICESRMISRVSGACRGVAYCGLTLGAWLCSLLLIIGVPAVLYLLAGGVIMIGLGMLTPRLLHEGAPQAPAV